MSYHYSPMTPHGPETELPHPGYIPHHSIPAQQASFGMANMQASITSCKDSKSSLRSSFPTPDVGPSQQTTPEAHSQSGEKKRNKLGYHRISLACGHCRRRKIRCIPSPSDIQGRCINCIRLKKECSFYPVDQQPLAESGGKSSSRSSAVPKRASASASSSPATSSGVPAELSKQSAFSPIAIPKMPSMAPPTLNAATSDGVAPKAKGEPEPGIITPAKLTTGGQIPSNISISRPYDFAGQSAASWIPADAAPSPISKPGDLGTTWRSFPPESPLGSQFSPYSHPPLSSATWTSASSESGSRDDSTWGNYPPPVRSMSYGGEPLASNHPTQYPSLPHSRQFDRRSSALSDVYPPPLSVTVPGMDVGHTSGIDHLVPLSAGAVPPPTFEGWHNQHQQHSQLPYSKSGDVFGDWGLGGDGDGQHLDTSEPGPHNEPNPNIYYTRR